MKNLETLFALADKVLYITIVVVILLAFYHNADRLCSIKTEMFEIEFYQSMCDTQ